MKIGHRHQFETVNKYLDDQLADNNDDAVKLETLSIALLGLVFRQQGTSLQKLSEC